MLEDGLDPPATYRGHSGVIRGLYLKGPFILPVCKSIVLGFEDAPLHLPILTMC